MKKLLVGIFVLGSATGFANNFGTPDQDPVVKNIRKRFASGKEPTKEYLLGQSFRCKDLMAVRDNFDKDDYNDLLTFEEFDGFLVSHQGDTLLSNVLFTFNGRELIGSTVNPRTNEVVYDAYRVDNRGYLISEYSITQLLNGVELEPISNAPGKVFSYTLCVKH